MYTGPAANILEPSALQCHRLYLENPILSLRDVEVIKNTNYRNWKTKVIDTTYPAEEGWQGLIKAIDRICQESSQAASDGYQILVLSDRLVDRERYKGNLMQEK